MNSKKESSNWRETRIVSRAGTGPPASGRIVGFGGNRKLYLGLEPVRQHDEELELEFEGNAMSRETLSRAGAGAPA